MRFDEREFAEALFLAFGLDKASYRLGINKVFFRPGKQVHLALFFLVFVIERVLKKRCCSALGVQMFLEEILNQSPTLTTEMVKKIKSLILRSRFRKLRAGILLLVRFMKW